MANPYHDENGKFCKKEEMFGAVLRLQQEGKTDEAAELFLKFKNAEASAKKKPVAKKTTKKTPVKKAPARAEAPEPAATYPPAGTYPNVDEMPPYAERGEVLASFILDYNLQAGTRDQVDAAERAYHEEWDRNGNYMTTCNYDPAKAEEDVAQRLAGFTNDDGDKKVLFAYKQRLYICTEAMDDSWGTNTKYGYDTEPADPTPVITLPGQKEGWKSAKVSNEDAAEGWGVTNRRNLPGPHEGTRNNVTWQAYEEEETSYGNWENRVVYKDESTGKFYQKTTAFSSWDTGYDDDREFWTEVEPHTYHIPANVEFKAWKGQN